MTKIKIAKAEKIINRILKIITGQEANEFNKRDSGLKLATFITAFTTVICGMRTVTLEGLANECKKIQYGLKLSKQSLHTRLKAGKKELKEVLSAAINENIERMDIEPHVALVFRQFARVLITDSTTLSLPDKLAKEHKGLGGTNAKSAMKIQATYDVKNKNFAKIEIVDNATDSDGSYVEELIETIVSNDLIINDLGYYGIAGFRAITQKGAYFISKIKSNTKVYKQDKKSESIDIKRELKEIDQIDKEVIIKGAKGIWTNVRLVGIRLPEKVYNERIRKARKAAKPSGKTLTAEEIERLKWILLVTNVERDILDAAAVCEIYRIRWQIELIFKTWKSTFAIDEMNNVGKDYLDCLIFGKLIVITMLNCLYSQLFHQVSKDMGRLLSYMRFMKNICEELCEITIYFTTKRDLDSLQAMIIRVILSSLIEKRKRKTSEQSIDSLDLSSEVLIMLR